MTFPVHFNNWTLITEISLIFSTQLTIHDFRSNVWKKLIHLTLNMTVWHHVPDQSFPHWIGNNQKHIKQTMNADKKLLETVFFDRWQSLTLLTINERGSKIARNSVFRLPFVARWARNSVFWLPFVARRATNGNQKHCFYNFLSTFVNSINVFDCRLSSVIL